MTILTEKEREDVYKYWLHSSTLTNEDGLIQLAEKAVLEKLAGMELPGPVAARWPSVPGSHTYAGARGCNPGSFGNESEDLFTAEQLHQAFAQGAASQLEQVPFGIWHIGDSEDESDFFLFEDSGDVACKDCIKLYTLKAPK